MVIKKQLRNVVFNKNRLQKFYCAIYVFPRTENRDKIIFYEKMKTWKLKLEKVRCYSNAVEWRLKSGQRYSNQISMYNVCRILVTFEGRPSFLVGWSIKVEHFSGKIQKPRRYAGACGFIFRRFLESSLRSHFSSVFSDVTNVSRDQLQRWRFVNVGCLSLCFWAFRLSTTLRTNANLSVMISH